jgi:hypothetical protein
MTELTEKLDRQEQPAQFFRPDESDRLERVKRWIKQARGDSPETTDLKAKDDKGR